MARSSKPRKAYKQKACVKPLGIKDSARMEIPGYMASQVLGTEHMTEPHLYDLVAHADMVVRIAGPKSEMTGRANKILKACSSIMARHLSTGKFGVSGDDLTSIRANIGTTMEYLRSVPNTSIWRAAKAALDEFDRGGALKVERLAA